MPKVELRGEPRPRAAKDPVTEAELEGQHQHQPDGPDAEACPGRGWADPWHCEPADKENQGRSDDDSDLIGPVGAKSGVEQAQAQNPVPGFDEGEDNPDDGGVKNHGEGRGRNTGWKADGLIPKFIPLVAPRVRTHHFGRMTKHEKEAVALIALAAAFCDGEKSDEERSSIRSLVENLELPNATGLVQRVLLKKVSLEEATAALAGPDARNLAYEMAVSIIEADGHRNEAEAQFLKTLADLLKLKPAQTVQPLRMADDFTAAAVPAARATSGSIAIPPRLPDPELDGTIRNTAILAGALELLPQSIATMAVLPLQTHLVYRVGKHYGYALDAGHIKEFIGVLGLGLTSQAFEGLARKFLGGLIKKAGGGLAGGLAKAATGPAITFATTYAMGQLAQRYYSGGRSLSSLQLKETFQKLFGSAQAQGQQLLPEIQARAKGLSLGQLPALIRGA